MTCLSALVRTVILLLSVLAYAPLDRVTPAAATGEPQESHLYLNFTKANTVLKAALKVHGGQALVDGSVSFRLTMEGKYLNEGHYEVPWAVHEYKMKGTLIYSADLQALRSDNNYNYDRDLVGFNIYDSTHGVILEAGASKPTDLEGEELNDSWRAQLAMFPQEYLKQALEHIESLRSLGEASGYDVIGYSLSNDTHYALYFDHSTHLLHRIENIGHWKTKGDRLEWKEFTNYQEQGGYMIPKSLRAHSEGYASQYGEEIHFSSIEFGVDFDATDFTIPEEFIEGFEDWTIAPPGLEKEEDPYLPVTELGRGLYIVDLPACDSRSLLIEFFDFSVIVEAGDHSEVSTKLLDTASHLLPSKPVRYVGMTHHHPLYSGGLRPYANRGVTILATAGNVDYYKDLTTRPYQVQPDAQERNPREPVIQVIDHQLIIEDQMQRVEFYAVDPGTHVEEFVLPYVPSHKLVITGDFFFSGKEDEELAPAGTRTKALYDIIQDRALDVETLVQTWYLEEGNQQAPMSDLEEKIRLAAVKEKTN